LTSQPGFNYYPERVADATIKAGFGGSMVCGKRCRMKKRDRMKFPKPMSDLVDDTWPAWGLVNAQRGSHMEPVG
jgi:hypothetical protein